MNEDIAKITVTAETAGKRLDVFVAASSGETRSAAQRLIENGCVLLNAGPSKPNTRLKSGDEVTIKIDPPRETELTPEDIPLDVVYEDADIIVVNKPKGMVVHPAAGNASGTLVNALLFHVKDLSGIGGEMRPGIVHRIDKLTSGLIVAAKNDMAHRALAQQIKAHAVTRTYVAIVEGNIREDSGTVDAPIGRDIKNRKRMAITRLAEGRHAITHWRVLERFGDFTLLELKLETGRTHQIRVHMAYIKHPVAGDTVYGRKKPLLGLDGQALHAYKLAFDHPRTHERMAFSVDLPDWFLEARRRIGRRNGQQ